VIKIVNVIIYFHHDDVDVPDIVIYDGLFLLLSIVNEGTNCSESDSNNGMMFSSSDYDTDEFKHLFTKNKRNITDSLQDYKEIVRVWPLKT
ncbi:hypothetical protein H5410_015753, partial [Solanum commersonii]